VLFIIPIGIGLFILGIPKANIISSFLAYFTGLPASTGKLMAIFLFSTSAIVFAIIETLASTAAFDPKPESITKGYLFCCSL
jgi:hypothetical protein